MPQRPLLLPAPGGSGAEGEGRGEGENGQCQARRRLTGRCAAMSAHRRGAAAVRRNAARL